jgi:hypothetical protein
VSTVTLLSSRALWLQGVGRHIAAQAKHLGKGQGERMRANGSPLRAVVTGLLVGSVIALAGCPGTELIGGATASPTGTPAHQSKSKHRKTSIKHKKARKTHKEPSKKQKEANKTSIVKCEQDEIWISIAPLSTAELLEGKSKLSNPRLSETLSCELAQTVVEAVGLVKEGLATNQLTESSLTLVRGEHEYHSAYTEMREFMFLSSAMTYTCTSRPAPTTQSHATYECVHSGQYANTVYIDEHRPASDQAEEAAELGLGWAHVPREGGVLVIGVDS